VEQNEATRCARCVSQSFQCCDKIPEENNLRVERFIWLTVSEISVHRGREGEVEQRAALLSAGCVLPLFPHLKRAE
jgi:hypothetical protein